MAVLTLSDTGKPGCPTGLQAVPASELDPLADRMDISSFVISNNGISKLDLIVQGAHCGGCLAKIERGIGEISGVENARMNLSTMRLTTQWKTGQTDPAEILSKLKTLGFGTAPYEINAAQAEKNKEETQLLKSMAVAGFAAMNVMLLSIAVWTGGMDMQTSTHSIFHWVSALIALPAVAYAGRPFFRSAWSALRQRQTNMDVPISLALILACSLSLHETIKGNPDTYFDAAVMLLFLLLIGRYLDARLRSKTGEAAQKLAALQSSSATRLLPDGRMETIPTRDVKPGDQLLIPAGQRIPVDAEIIAGSSELDVQIATGELKPQSVSIGNHIYSGTINIAAPLTVRALSAETDSFLAEITRLVEIGEQGRSRYVRIADKAARLYVPVVHSLAILTFAGWLVAGAGLRPAVLNAIAVLIITCPCALGLAVPAVHIVASGHLFAKGILLKSGDALERLAQVKWVVFDKTGTLTTGQLELVNGAEITPETLSYAAALAAHSRHPIARALRKYDTGIAAQDVKETPGLGLTGTIGRHKVRLIRSEDISNRDAAYTASELQIDDKSPVKFLFQDTIRTETPTVVKSIKAMGLATELLSGDRQTTAQFVAKQIGIERAKGRVSPDEKQSILYQRSAEGRMPLMVGDGINDAPALAAAHASVSLADGSDISRATSDVILQSSGLAELPTAIHVAHKANRRVIENLSFAAAYNFFAIPLAVFGFVNPLIAALAMSGSSLIVTLNALRMKTA